MKVHRVTLLVVDQDDIGAGSVARALEDARYQNHCIAPSVMQVDTVDVGWHDGHPLNMRDTMRAEFDRLFARQKETTS